MVKVLSVICTVVLHVCFLAASGVFFPGLGGGSRADMQKLLDVTLHTPHESRQEQTTPQPQRVLPDPRRGAGAAPQSVVKEISSVKRDSLLLGKQGTPNEETKRRIYFGGGILKQGNEIRLNLRAIGAMDFGKKDFYGTYKLSCEDMIIEIKPWGDELILEIPKMRLRRPLKSVGKFIWTYGPSFSESEPVEGSITFFPHHHEPNSLPSRVMWMGKEPPMHIGVMQDWD